MTTQAKEEPSGSVPLSDSCVTSAFYKALITEAPFFRGDHGIPPVQLDLQNSDLNDPELIASGKEFVHRNLYSVILSHLTSLMWVFTFKRGRAVLLRTGESHNKDASLTRYLSTVLRIKSWYESDLLEQTANKDLYGVRKMHAAALRNYKKTQPPSIPPLTSRQRQILDVVHASMSTIVTSSGAPASTNTDNPQVPVSQFDMVITQFCFVGFILLMPESFGVKETEGLDGFVHLWAIFGRSLGIQDRFYLAIHYKATGGNLDDFWRIYKNMFLVNLKKADETAVVMWDSLIYGCSKYMRQLRLLAVIKFMVDIATGKGSEGRGKELEMIMGWSDYLSYKFLVWGTQTCAKWRLLREIRNFVIRFHLFLAQIIYLPPYHKQQ